MSEMQVTFTLDVPDGVSQEDLLAWLKFELSEVAHLSGSNPLASEGLSTMRVRNVKVD